MKHAPLRRSTRALGATLVIAAAFALAGCANPIEQLVNRGAENALEKMIEQGSGGKLDLNTDGEGGYSIDTEDGGSVNIGANASVPDAWPGLPVPDGKIVVSSSDAENNTFNLTFQTTIAEAEKLTASLQNQGFTEKSSVDIAAVQSRTFESNEYRVIVGWLGNNDPTTLTYMVLPL